MKLISIVDPPIIDVLAVSKTVAALESDFQITKKAKNCLDHYKGIMDKKH